MEKLKFKDGFYDSVPLIIGFIPIAMTFGLLARSNAFSLFETTAFSMFVFAGSSQFIAINLLALNTDISQIIIATLLINFRHFLMGLSIKNKFDKSLKPFIPLIAFGITDETFSILSFKKENLTKEYTLSLELFAYLSWVGGTFSGYVIGNFLPQIVQKSMGIALYALFISLLIPEVKKEYKYLYLAIISGVLNTVFIKIFLIPQGWSIILSIIITSLLGVQILKVRREAVYE